MEDLQFLFATLSLIFLLFISSFVYIFSKKIKVPYTVLLVVVGLLLIPLSTNPFFSFIDDFRLTPEVLFFVFLPVLLFESSYNINYKQIIKEWKPVAGLAILGLIVSTIIISVLLYGIFYFADVEIPFLVLLLFGALISATDPVAVLAIFKKMGAPCRLALIFEGESLFNDGTAVALFMVILGIILEGHILGLETVSLGVLSFVSMVFGGLIFGGIMGILFSKILGSIRYNEEAEVTITMISAHATFLLAELITYFSHFTPLSGVIATVTCSIIIGNYGKYKITPRVEQHMQRFWEFFAFIANTVVFILMGITLSYLEVDMMYFVPFIVISIIVVAIARAGSVYGVVGILNKFAKGDERIPMTWQHLLSWGSLRGALAIIMVLLIPGKGEPGYIHLLHFQEQVGWSFPFDVQEFLLVLTIGSVMFTLFIKATTISYIMHRLKVDKLGDLEELEYEEGKILSNFKILNKLENSYKKAYLSQIEYSELFQKYENRLKNALFNIKAILKNNEENELQLIAKALSLHALGIEKQYLKDLFMYNEIDEKNFKYILRKIEQQIYRIEEGRGQIRSISGETEDYDIFTKLFFRFFRNFDNPINEYIRNRAKAIITSKVITELRMLSEIDFGFDKTFFDDIIELYAQFNKSAEKKKNMISLEIRATIMGLESRLVDKSLLRLEEEVLKDLFQKEIITPKLYIKFMDEIEEEMFMDVKRLS